MKKIDGLAWGKKVYLWLSLAVVAVIWICFFGSLWFGRLSHGPVEETWFGEIMKWVFMTPILVVIVDGIAYALIGTLASRKQAGLDQPKVDEVVDEQVKTVEETKEKVEPEVSEPDVKEVLEIPAEAPVVKKPRKKKAVKE